MTTLITNDLRAIDFDHVFMTCVAAGTNAEPWVSVVLGTELIRLFEVKDTTDEEKAELVARVVAHCMESDADVVLEDVIIKEWKHAIANIKAR